MDRPQAQASSKVQPRRRIVPIAVAPQDQAPVSPAFDAEQPLVVAPPPAQGSSKQVSVSGQGRRIWVDIHSTIEVKFKEVLRQQGLEYKTWRVGMQQRRAQLDAAAGAQCADARRQGLSAAGVYQRTQGMYEVLDDDEEDEDEEEETASEAPAEGAGEEGDAAGSSGEHDEEDEEDDEEDDKGNDTGGEVDLEKEEKEGRGKAPKPKRQRFERYDDDFIDDSELEMVKGAGPTKTKFSGFYVTHGNVETIDEPSKPRAKPKSRQPKNTDAAAGAAGAAGPGRKRKQPDKTHEQQEPPQQQQQQQQKKKQQELQQQQQDRDGAASGQGRKKRQRSETPAGQPAQDKPPAGKKAKPPPAPPTAAVQQPAAAGADAGAMAAPAAAAAAANAGGTAAKAMAGIKAALAAKKKPPAGDNKPSTVEPAAAAAAAADSKQQEQQHDKPQQPVTSVAAEQHAAEPPPAVEPAVDAAEAAAAAAAGGAMVAAAAAGLAAAVVKGVEALQHAVAEHKPPMPGGASKSATMSKAVRHALDSLGLTFARLPKQAREQQTPSLLSALGPLMLPYMREKKLRRLLLDEAASRAGELHGTREDLFRQLEACRAAGGPSDAAGAGDEDFQPHMSPAAEEALAAAWAAHTSGTAEQLTQLAVDVCAKLGWANVQPDKAVAELKQIVKQAKKRMAKNKAAAAAGALSQQPSLQQQLSGGFGSSQQSPEPSAAAAAATEAPAGGTPGLTPQRQQHDGTQQQQQQLQQQLGLAPVALAAQSGGTAGSSSASQKQPAEKFSTLSAPSPRLRRCLDAAEAAGAPREWLHEKYATLRGKHMHQMFRTLCVSGPAGCTIKAMVGRAAEHGLNVAWEDSTAARSALKQSLAGNAMSAVAGTTEADPKAYALLCFPGVQKQPAKPPRAAPEAAAGGQQSMQGEAE